MKMTEESPKSELPELDYATQVIEKIIEFNPKILLASFLRYKTYNGIIERIHSDSKSYEMTSGVINDAKELNSSFNYPFHDSLMTLIMFRDSIPDDVIKQCLFHPINPYDKFFDLLRNEVKEINIKALSRNLNVDEAIAISSRVHLVGGEINHIPMLDFRCPVTSNNLKSIKIALSMVGQTDGYILNSGRSYHYYGLRLLDQSEWIKFMVQMLLLPSLIDSRYIAHRLLDGYTTLRILSNKIKTSEPFVIDGPKL